MKPEQEPVGTVGSLFDENVIMRRMLERDMLVYTTPPQRTWVGLTDEERINISYKADGNECVAVELTEAKLKELNHG
jgi:hypothetical protein